MPELPENPTDPTPTRGPLTPSRRQVMSGVAGGLAAAAFAGGIVDATSAAAAVDHKHTKLPKPGDSQIDKIVVLMMENRSFDHMLGWLPGADGKQKGLSFRDKAGKLESTYHLPFTQSCGYYDPDHSYSGGRIEFNHGKLDGWLKTKQADLLPIGYYEQHDLAFYGHAAPHWTVCDQYFAATLGPTYPNRFYQHAAQTDRDDDSTMISHLPTIWDRLKEAGLSHRYYFSDIPFTVLWGQKYISISEPVDAFMTAAKEGTLPAVSFVDPRFKGEGNGTSGDDHPLADIRAGQYFVSTVYDALVNGKDWDRTLLVVNYDEWGGFFDHVKPAKAPDANPKYARRGFRVPAMVIGPRARRSYIAHDVYDHASVLKMIEWRFGLKPLTPRDKAARNLAEVLDFSAPPKLEAPTWTVPDVHPDKCKSTKSADDRTSHEYQWNELLDMARRQGFDV